MSTHARLLIVYFLLMGLAAGGATGPQNEQDIRHQIAEPYGFRSFGQVEQLRFTFHAHLGEKHVSRSWVWETKKDRVSFEGTDQQGKPLKLTYLRSESNDQVKQVDPDFINDQYWLLFPFHLVWDQAAKVEDTGPHKLPIGRGSARRVLVTYPSAGGYTPGDSYELFVGKDYRILQWAYHRGGAAKPTLAAAWEENRQFGPLTLSLNHPGADKSFRVWFTDVAVKLVGSDQWVSAK